MIFGVDISTTQLALILLGGFSLGVSKTGFPGLALINILVVATIFGARESAGIILPLLVFCDLIVYPLFRKYASWRDILPLLWPTMIGLVIGYALLKVISNDVAAPAIGIIILIMMILQFARQHRPDFLADLPDSRAFRWGSGGAIGVSTALANAAGPVYSIYALVRKMEKNRFLGIGARFFLLVNLIKILPLLQLDLITTDTLRINALMVPGILVGLAAGKTLIRYVPQQVFEWLLYAFSLIAAVRMIFF